MKTIQNIGLILQFVILLLVVLAVLATSAPLYHPDPGRDQGVYLYIGQQILDGKIPYRDVWDHKGPIIYYINALGLYLTGSAWGVWILEIVFLFTAALLGYFAIRSVFDAPIAFASSILWLISLPSILIEGNHVEEYSLLFQFASIYFYFRSEKEMHGYWNEFLIGVTAALSLALRPNNIGVHVSIVLVLLLNLIFSPKRRSQNVKQIINIIFGGLVVLSAIAVYFAINDSLWYLFDTVFVYNYYYSRMVSINYWESLAFGYKYLTFLIPLGLLGLIGAAGYYLRYWKHDTNKTHFALFVFVATPVQMYLSIISGRLYTHYYIGWLPVFALLTCFFIYLVTWIFGKLFRGHGYKAIFEYLVVFGLILEFGWGPVVSGMHDLVTLASNFGSPVSNFSRSYLTVEQSTYVGYILENTRPDDYLLIWGNETTYNFLTERRSPSRFVYTYAFETPGYASQEMADELLSDIIKKRPLIIDSNNGINSRSRRWRNLPIARRIIKFIERNYILIDHVGPHDWSVWIYKGE